MTIAHELASVPSPEAPRLRSRATLRRVVPAALLLALVLGAGKFANIPRDQHVTFVLGDRARQIDALEIQYFGPDCTPHDCDEPAREVRLTFERGRAPRVVPHEARLPDGRYALRIASHTPEGRRTVERQVTLGEGTQTIDVSNALRDRP